ncbi:MAG: hypothetical protein QOI38_2570 [Sphingomonadales bacterium]|jgi:hypothetical protein|nr:hypothetical protein [Sphingomonadales bacterium]
MAFHLHQSQSPGAGLTSFHLHETENGRNSAVYVIVPTPSVRRAGIKMPSKSARQLAKAALLEAAAAL